MKNIIACLLMIYFGLDARSQSVNVGINKTAPQFKLDVDGSINSDSAYRLRGRTILSNGFYGSLYIGDSAGAGLGPFTTSHNTLIGDRAGARLIDGTANAFIGTLAGYKTTSGDYNSFFGEQSGTHNTTGQRNCYVGYGAGLANTTAQMNSFFGYLAGDAHYQTGSFNTILGAMAGKRNFIGSHNTFFGYDVDVVSNALFDIDNSTAIGYQARTSASNQMRFGNGNVTSIGGYVGWSNLSDGRFKKNIQEDVKGLDFIKRLRPVTYSLDQQKLAAYENEDHSNELIKQQPIIRSATVSDRYVYSGFIAQEVEQAARETGFAFGGVDAPKDSRDVYALRYAEFTVPLVKAVQELADQNEQLKKEVKQLKRLMAHLPKSRLPIKK